MLCIYFVFLLFYSNILSGGLQGLFGNKDTFSVTLSKGMNPKDFVIYIRDSVLNGDSNHAFSVDDTLFVYPFTLFI